MRGSERRLEWRESGGREEGRGAGARTATCKLHRRELTKERRRFAPGSRSAQVKAHLKSSGSSCGGKSRPLPPAPPAAQERRLRPLPRPPGSSSSLSTSRRPSASSPPSSPPPSLPSP